MCIVSTKLLTQLWEQNIYPKPTLFFLYRACIMPQNVTLTQFNKFEMWNVTLTQDVTTFDAKGNNIFNSKICKKQSCLVLKNRLFIYFFISIVVMSSYFGKCDHLYQVFFTKLLLGCDGHFLIIYSHYKEEWMSLFSLIFSFNVRKRESIEFFF